MAWFASTALPTFAHIIRPERFATDAAAHGNLKDTARSAFWDICREINRSLDGKKWMMGANYTVCDAYAFFFYDLGSRIKLPVHELGTYATFNKRMQERPAVGKVRELEERAGRECPQGQRHLARAILCLAAKRMNIRAVAMLNPWQ
jgi:glutathione S-transferase